MLATEGVASTFVADASSPSDPSWNISNTRRRRLGTRAFPGDTRVVNASLRLNR